MTEAELRAAIKAGPSGGFLFFGEELYLMRRTAQEFSRAVLSGDGSFDAFNHTVLEGEATPGELENALAALPLMAEHTLVEWRSPPLDNWREEETGAFCSLFARLGTDYPQAVLLLLAPRPFFDPGTPPKRPSALFKKLDACLSAAAFSLQPDERLRRWIAKHLAGDGLTAAPETLSRMLAVCGREMDTLSGEIDKLTAYALAAGRSEVLAADVDAVCCTAPEEDAFGLANAVVNGDRRAALDALYWHKLRREEPLLLLGSVARVMCDLLCVARLREAGMERGEIAAAMKMHVYKCGLYCQAVEGTEPDRLAAALERCRECDRRMKRSAPGYETLERLICTIPARRKKA